MKSIWIRTMALTLAVVCMTGCSTQDFGEQPTKVVAAEVVENKGSQQGIASPEESGTESGQTGKDELVLNPELFDGTDIRMWNGKGNNLLVLKGSFLYLYDVASARIKAKTETELSDAAVFYPYGEGYFVIDWITKGDLPWETQDDGSMFVEVGDDDIEYFGIFYDDSLKELQRLVLDDIVEHPACDVWAISPDGAMLGYYDLWEGLNLYDLSNQKKQNLIGAEMEKNGSRLLAVNALFFEEGKNSLIFTGQTDQDGSTCASWGRIGMDGSGFENHILGNDLGEAAGYHGGKLLIGEDSILFKDGVAVVDTETGETVYHADFDRTLPLSDPYFSPDGTVFATAALDTQQMEIGIYHTTDSTLIYKEMVKDDREEMFYRSPQICLFPDLRVCIVSMGGHDGIPQKTVLLMY